jgi:hypothetical protein
MPQEEARAFWQRFSDWMEDHRGDLAGFAAREGFASVHPTVADGRPVLRASRAEAQRPYAPVTAGAGWVSRDSGGSPPRQSAASTPRSDRASKAKSRKKRRP